MITREDIEKLTIDQVGQSLERDTVVYGESLHGMSKEELEKEESELIKQMDEYDHYLCEVKYELPDSVNFDNKNYTRAEVARKVVYFIGRMDSDFRTTLGLYELCNVWKGDIKDISYKVYDSTLNTLGTLRYKGYDEWKDILIIHNYMSQCHEKYMKDLAYQLYLSTKHNDILNIINPQPQQVNEEQK